MKTIYLDIFSGISGDMFIGALLDLGVEFKQLERELRKLKLDGYHLHAARGQKANIEGVKFDVHLEHDHDDHHARAEEHEHGHHHEHSDRHGHASAHQTHDEHEHGDHEHEHEHEHEHGHGPEHTHSHAHGRNFADIKKLIGSSPLSAWVKEKSTAIFHRIAVAEGKIHGLPPEAVHFHEVGAVDSIVDIVGACVALELLGKPRVTSGPGVDGHGWINCAHGRFPIPAPATLGILAQRKIPISQSEEPHELGTPTGAAILAELAESFGPLQNLTPERIGYGLGTRDNKTRPNVLRAVLCETSGSTEHDWETDTVVTLQTNLDDISSELLGAFMEQALAAGALGVFYAPIQMKKKRPGGLLSVLAGAAGAGKFFEMIFPEAPAFC